MDYLFSGRAADGYLRWGSSGIIAPSPVSPLPAIRGRISGWRTLKGLSPLRFWQDLRALDCRVSTIWSSATSSRSVPMQLAAGANPASPSAIRRASTGRSCAGESGFNRQSMRHFAPVRQSLGLHWFHFRPAPAASHRRSPRAGAGQPADPGLSAIRADRDDRGPCCRVSARSRSSASIPRCASV